jgi:hypothetical protein
MEDRSTDRPRFDEGAALAELERLRQQIALRRSERRETGEEFERFVRSFRKPRFVGPPSPRTPIPQPAPSSAARNDASPPSPPQAVHRAPVSSPAAAEPEVVTRPEPDVVPAPEPAIVASAEREAVAGRAAPAAIAAPAQTRKRARMLGGGALMLIVASGLAAWTLRQKPGTPSSPVSTAPTTAAPAREVPTPSAVAAPAIRQSEIITTRRVWMRVIVDGERVLEREVPAGTRVPLTARETVVIRTGDAGAVRVSIGGRDHGLLGGAGEVVTRTFTVPAEPAR